MGNVYGPVWVIAEQRDCRIRDVSLQLMGQAQRLAAELNTDAEAVLFGNRMKDHIQPLFSAGARRIYLGNDPQLAFYEPEVYVEMIVRLAREYKPDIILTGSTAMGRELAPLVAARLQTGLTAHCIDLVLDDRNILEQRIPAYGGLLSIVCPQKRPQMATIAKGVFTTPDLDEQRSGEIIPVAVPEDMQGRSLRGLARGDKPKDWRRSIYYHYYAHGKHNVPRHYGVRTERYKLIHYYTDDLWELFDLEKDPHELKSEYGNTEYAAVRENLSFLVQFGAGSMCPRDNTVASGNGDQHPRSGVVRITTVAATTPYEHRAVD